MNETSHTIRKRDATGSGTLVESPSLFAGHDGRGSTLVDISIDRAAHHGSQHVYTFLKNGEIEAESLSYESLDRRARSLAVWLRENGGAGERALLLYPPGLDFLVGFFGCLYAGTVAVPLYPPRPNRRDSRITEIAKDADARFALTSSAVIAKLDRSLDHSPELARLKWCATDELSPESNASAWRSEWPKEPDDVAYLQYTSGSTRSPQGVMVSQINVLANIADIELSVRHGSESVFVTWLPHFHDMGLVYGLLAPWSMGFPCYLLPPASFLQHPARWLRAVSRYRATHSGGPNFAYDLCTRRVTPEQKAGLDLRSWTVAFNGAEPVRAKTLEAFASAFASCGLSKGALRPTYGLAEATLKVSLGAMGSETRLLSLRSSELSRNRVVEADEGEPNSRTVVSCGFPETTEVLIVNPATLVRCRPDEVGEIWLHGPIVAGGYWRRPEETNNVFHASLAGVDGGTRYLRTGDLGFMRDGELFITGRFKDLIIIRGRNHYPQDIELTVESSHPAFRAGGAAAISVESEDEERLVIVQEIDRHHRSLDVDQVAAAARKAVADEHELNLSRLVLVKQGAIPKTSSGKVQRRACARSLLERSLPVVLEWIERNEEPPTTRVSPLGKDAPGPEDIESFVSGRLSSLLGIHADDIDLEQPFSALGIDSARALTFLGELEIWLDRRLSPTLFWNYPTIAALAKHLGETSSDERKASKWNP